jgi:hypothetical protein
LSLVAFVPNTWFCPEQITDLNGQKVTAVFKDTGGAAACDEYREGWFGEVDGCIVVVNAAQQASLARAQRALLQFKAKPQLVFVNSPTTDGKGKQLTLADMRQAVGVRCLPTCTEDGTGVEARFRRRSP